MQLFVMRHGAAAPYDYTANTVVDEQRPLTVYGRAETTNIATWLNSVVSSVDLILVSPFTRAQQTAEIMAQHLSNAAMQTSILLIPEASAVDFHHYLDGLLHTTQLDKILLVSHMPLVSYLVAELTAEQQTPIFQTAAIAELNYDQHKMQGQLMHIQAPS